MMRSQCAYLRVSCFHSKQISAKLNLSETKMTDIALNSEVQTHKSSRRTLLIRIKHNGRIFAVIPPFQATTQHLNNGL